MMLLPSTIPTTTTLTAWFTLRTLSLRVYAIVHPGNVLVLKGGAAAMVLEVTGTEETVDIVSRAPPNYTVLWGYMQTLRLLT